jgi:hypothetical protein
MVAYLENEGWIRLYWSAGVNTMDLHAEDWSYDKDDPSPITIDYANRGHVGFTMNAEKVVIKLKNVWVDTEAKWNILKTRLEAAEDAGDCKIRIQVRGTVTTPYFELFNGVAGKDVMPVIIKSKKGYTKKYRGQAQFYMIKNITLIQTGALE